MGLARFCDGRADDLTRNQDETAVLGTLDYIAPEQALAGRAVDSRADIYSLGATLYALLGGSPPFGGKSSVEKLLAHQLAAPPPLHQARPSVPRALSAVIEKMMAKQPEDRFPSMAAVQEALAPFAKRRPIGFDFPAILNRRRDEAQARLAKQGRTLTQMVQRQSTTSAHGSQASLQNTGMAQETDVRRDVTPGVHPKQPPQT